MLDVFASIAQILGFALQVVDHLSKDHGAPPRQNDTRMVFQGLLALSSASKSWKGLHSQYHPLNKQVQSVIGEVSEYRNGIYVPKLVEDVAPSNLRRRFFDNVLNDAVAHFDINTRKETRDIQRSLNTDDASHKAAIDRIRAVDNSLADEFIELAALKDDALKIHDRFTGFLSQVRGFIGNPRWGDTEVRYILDNRMILASDLPQMIYVTDKVLMTFLDIYIKLVFDYARVTGIPNPQPRV